MEYALYTLYFLSCVNRNEHEVGCAVKKSGISRSDVFVVTKLMWTNHGYENCKAAFADSLKK